jgi:hypothetical protein
MNEKKWNLFYFGRIISIIISIIDFLKARYRIKTIIGFPDFT